MYTKDDTYIDFETQFLSNKYVTECVVLFKNLVEK